MVNRISAHLRYILLLRPPKYQDLSVAFRMPPTHVKQGVGHSFDLWDVLSIMAKRIQTAEASLWAQGLSDENVELEVVAYRFI